MYFSFIFGQILKKMSLFRRPFMCKDFSLDYQNPLVRQENRVRFFLIVTVQGLMKSLPKQGRGV